MIFFKLTELNRNACVSGEFKAGSVSGASCRGVVDGGNTGGRPGLWEKGCGKWDCEQFWWPANRTDVLLECDPVQLHVGKLVVAVPQCEDVQGHPGTPKDTQRQPGTPRDIHLCASCPSPPLGRAELSLGIRTRDQNPGTPRILGNVEGDIVSHMIMSG